MTSKIVTSNCFNDSQVLDEIKLDQFIFVNQQSTVDFSEALEVCKDLDSTLARISSLDEFKKADDFLNTLNLTDGFVWIGLRRESDDSFPVGTNLDDPTNFEFVDGVNENRSFYSSKGVFPWDDGNPNNSNGNQACVSWSRSNVEDNQEITFNSWNDEQCEDKLDFILCRQQCTSNEGEVDEPDVDEPVVDDPEGEEPDVDDPVENSPPPEEDEPEVNNIVRNMMLGIGVFIILTVLILVLIGRRESKLQLERINQDRNYKSDRAISFLPSI